MCHPSSACPGWEYWILILGDNHLEKRKLQEIAMDHSSKLQQGRRELEGWKHKKEVLGSKDIARETH